VLLSFRVPVPSCVLPSLCTPPFDPAAPLSLPCQPKTNRTSPTTASAPLPSFQLLNITSESGTRASSSESPGEHSGAGVDSDGEGWRAVGGGSGACATSNTAAAAYASVAAAVRRTALNGSAPIHPLLHAEGPDGSFDLNGAAGSDVTGCQHRGSDHGNGGEAWASEDSRAHHDSGSGREATPHAAEALGHAAAAAAAAQAAGATSLTAAAAAQQQELAVAPLPIGLQRTQTGESEHAADSAERHQAEQLAVELLQQHGLAYPQTASAAGTPPARQPHSRHHLSHLPPHFDLSSDVSGSPLQHSKRPRARSGSGAATGGPASAAPPQWAGDRPGQSSLFNGVCHKNGRCALFVV